MKKVVVVIPTYNEAATIDKLLKTIFRLIPEVNIVVVDDNSPDKTADKVKTLLKKYRRLHLKIRRDKGGRGSAVMAGFRYAFKKLKPDFYIEMDADFSHNPRELAEIIKQSQPKRVILASRYLKKSRIINWPIRRHIASRLANLLVRLILRLPLADNTNGYRCYQEPAIKILIKHQFKNSGYIVLSESAYLLSQHGFGLIEVPSLFVSNKADNTNATIREFIDAFRGLLKIKKYINSKPTKN